MFDNSHQIKEGVMKNPTENSVKMFDNLEISLDTAQISELEESLQKANSFELVSQK